MRAAYGPRSGLARFVRHTQRRLAVGPIRVARRLMRSQPEIDHLRVEPPPATAAEWSDLAARINWYLPGLDAPVVVGHAPPAHPASAPHMAAELVRDPPSRARAAEGAGHVVLARSSLPRLVRRGRRLPATTIVDPEMWGGEDTKGFPELMRLTGEGGASTASIDRLLDRAKPGGTALVVGTGPSAEEVDPD